jgi:hypothetical protein
MGATKGSGETVEEIVVVEPYNWFGDWTTYAFALGFIAVGILVAWCLREAMSLHGTRDAVQDMRARLAEWKATAEREGRS